MLSSTTDGKFTIFLQSITYNYNKNFLKMFLSLIKPSII